MAAIRKPGVQMPHCKAACSMNFSCKGCRAPPSASPSTVLTSRPSASAPSTRQEQTRRPSSRTLQAPQSPVPQPSLAPVRPHLSRSESSRVSSGGQAKSTGSPLMRVLTIKLLIACLLSVPPSQRRFWRRAWQGRQPPGFGIQWCRACRLWACRRRCKPRPARPAPLPPTGCR